MRRHMKIAFAIAMMGLFALMFFADAAGNDAGVTGAQPKPEYVFASNPHLPIKRLVPLW